MGERRHPDVGLVGAGRDVDDLGDGLRHPRHLAEAALGQDVAALLELQGRHHREEVGVAHALPVAVGRALHVRGAGVHGRQRVGHRAAGVVLGVDAQPRARGLADLGHDAGDVGGQHAAVGVAQHDHVGARLGGGAHHAQRIGGVVPVAVEEVLAVEEHPPAAAAQEGDGVGDHRQVLLAGGAQRPLHVPDVALGHQGDHRRAGVAQRQDLGVLLGAHPRPPGGAEGRQPRVAQVQLGGGALEELGVLGVRPRPAALDERHPELVEELGDGQLVGDGEVDALALGPVAQRGVEDVETVVRHGFSNSRGSVCSRGAGPAANKKDPSWTREVSALARSGFSQRASR